MAVHVKTLGVLFLVMLVSYAHAAETAPKGVSISLPPFTSKFKCSIQSGIPDATTKNTCIPGTQGNGIFISFSGTDSDVYSVRYQYSSPVQLWKKNSKYVASFSTSFTINIDQYTDEYSFIGGGGIAFAITPSISTTNTNAESLGLFPTFSLLR